MHSSSLLANGAVSLPAPVTLRVIREVGEWDALREAWTQLFALSPTASPVLDFDWLREWWRIYGPAYGGDGSRRDAGLRILTVWRERRLIGALPLYENRRGGRLVAAGQLGFISSGEAEFEETCADYLDLLHLPGEQSACLEAIGPALLERRDLRWDRLELTDVADRSPLLPALAEALAPAGRVRVRQGGVCPLADISGGLEAYLARLSANTRQQGRRLLRAAEKASTRFELAQDPEQAQRFFADLIRLHQARWAAAGRPGVFSAGRFSEFHRTLARLWVPAGKAVLARLSLEERPLSVLYGFVSGGRKFDFYQSGNVLDEPQALKSPGTVNFLLLMGHLGDRGFVTFDFLRGASGYKQRLATHEQRLWTLRVVRPTLRSGACALSDLAGRALRKSWRILRRPDTAPAATSGQEPAAASAEAWRP